MNQTFYKTQNKNWKNEVVPCDCPRWSTCKYGATIYWQYSTYAVCGYSFMTTSTRGCSVDKCDKYQQK